MLGLLHRPRNEATPMEAGRQLWKLEDSWFYCTHHVVRVHDEVHL